MRERTAPPQPTHLAAAADRLAPAGYLWGQRPYYTDSGSPENDDTS